MFTRGHATPSALLSLIKYSRPDGLIIASTRASYAKLTGFESFLTEKILGSDVQLLFCVRDARYIEEEGGHYWVLRPS